MGNERGVEWQCLDNASATGLLEDPDGDDHHRIGGTIHAELGRFDRRHELLRLIFHSIDDALYAAAYRAVDRAKDRERQIDLIALLGQALDKLAQVRFVGMTLMLMRKPAQLAGRGELQAFVERGYAAFGATRGRRVRFDYRRPRAGDRPRPLRRRR